MMLIQSKKQIVTHFLCHLNQFWQINAVKAYWLKEWSVKFASFERSGPRLILPNFLFIGLYFLRRRSRSFFKGDLEYKVVCGLLVFNSWNGCISIVLIPEGAGCGKIGEHLDWLEKLFTLPFCLNFIRNTKTCFHK